MLIPNTTCWYNSGDQNILSSLCFKQSLPQNNDLNESSVAICRHSSTSSFTAWHGRNSAAGGAFRWYPTHPLCSSGY